MRKILFASAAVAAIAIAAPAFAGDDTTNNQINRFTVQAALTNLNNLSVGANLSGSAAAVGNTISVNSYVNAPSVSNGVAQDSTSVASAQINRDTLQIGAVNIDDVNIDGRLTVSAQAVGNNGSFRSENGDIDVKSWMDDALASGGNLSADATSAMYAYNEGFAYQSNSDTAQIALANLNDVRVDGRTQSGTLAVGNNLSFEAPNGNASAVAFQTNRDTLQLALTNVEDSRFFGMASINSQAVGNASSWSSLNYGAADGINFQSNIGTAQISLTNIIDSNFGANLTAGAVSVGNLATVTGGVAPVTAP